MLSTVLNVLFLVEIDSWLIAF